MDTISTATDFSLLCYLTRWYTLLYECLLIIAPKQF